MKKRKQARWSIFEKRGDTWVRMTDKSYFYLTATHVWFYTLLENIGSRRLQKVRF